MAKRLANYFDYSMICDMLPPLQYNFCIEDSSSFSLLRMTIEPQLFIKSLYDRRLKWSNKNHYMFSLSCFIFFAALNKIFR